MRIMIPLARIFLLLGMLFLLVAGLLFLLGRFNIPLGHLPGDIRIESKNGIFYFPLTTCIMISLLLSGLLALVSHFWKR